MAQRKGKRELSAKDDHLAASYTAWSCPDTIELARRGCWDSVASPALIISSSQTTGAGYGPADKDEDKKKESRHGKKVDFLRL
jgi:hypothetical protein